MAFKLRNISFRGKRSSQTEFTEADVGTAVRLGYSFCPKDQLLNVFNGPENRDVCVYLFKYVSVVREKNSIRKQNLPLNGEITSYL